MADAGNGIGPRRRALTGDAFTGVTKAARDLGLCERTIRRAIAAGELPVYVFSRQARLRIVDVRARIAAPVAIAADTPQIEMPDASGADHSRLKWNTRRAIKYTSAQ